MYFIICLDKDGFVSDNLRNISCMFDYDGEFFSASGNISTVKECASKCRETFAYPYASIGQ